MNIVREDTEISRMRQCPSANTNTDDPLFLPPRNHVLLATDAFAVAQMVIKHVPFSWELVLGHFIFAQRSHPLCFSVWNTEECTAVATVSVESRPGSLAPLFCSIENDPNTSMCWQTRLASKQWCWSHKIWSVSQLWIWAHVHWLTMKF